MKICPAQENLYPRMNSPQGEAPIAQPAGPGFRAGQAASSQGQVARRIVAPHEEFMRMSSSRTERVSSKLSILRRTL